MNDISNKIQNTSLLILGAGGHGRVVAETAELIGKWDRISFLDDNMNLSKVLDFDVIGKLNDFEKFRNEFDFAVVAIGDNMTRIQWLDRLKCVGYRIPVIVHPQAIISKYAIVKEGTIVLPGAVVNTNSKIGRGCIINLNACVDHDCEISEGVHISAGAVIRSMCKIGRLSVIGASCCVPSGTQLDDGYILPDGKVVEFGANL